MSLTVEGGVREEGRSPVTEGGERPAREAQQGHRMAGQGQGGWAWERSTERAGLQSVSNLQAEARFRAAAYIFQGRYQHSVLEDMS